MKPFFLRSALMGAQTACAPTAIDPSAMLDNILYDGKTVSVMKNEVNWENITLQLTGSYYADRDDFHQPDREKKIQRAVEWLRQQ